MDANNISVAMELQAPTLPFFVAGFCLFTWQDSGSLRFHAPLPKLERRLNSTDGSRLERKRDEETMM